MQPQPECYGGMYPDLSAHKFNEVRPGKVFNVFVRAVGSAFMTARSQPGAKNGGVAPNVPSIGSASI